MADRNWWFNKAGAVGPISNPGSNVPNYGLTFDVATAPWDEGTDFEDLAESLSGVLSSIKTMWTPQAHPATGGDKTPWDRATGAAGWLGNQAAGVAGVANEGLRRIGLEDLLLSDEEEEQEEALRKEADEKGLTGWERYQFLAKGSLGNQMEEVTEGSVSGPALEALDSITKHASAAMLFATLSQEDEGFDQVGERWQQARRMAFDGNWSPGEAFMSLGWEAEVLDDDERMEKIRQSHTLFNTGALAFNVIAAWKADPTVLGGKAAGKVGDIRAGRLAEGGRAAEVQRDILAATSREQAAEKARSYTGIADRVRANRGLSLYDKAQGLRSAAQTLGFEDFKNLSPFQNSASGVVMAKLMKDTAHNDDDWNLVFRTAIGDPDAVDELYVKRGEIADKIEAIEARSLPTMERELERVEDRYLKRVAEQGRDADAGLEITRYGDWLLDNDYSVLKADVEGARATLATYQTHESWMQRALPGLDLDTDTINNRVANSVFGNLEQVAVGENPLLSAGRATRASLYELGGKVTTWRHDDYSPVARMFRAPAKPFLKRTGVVSLNDVSEGGEAVNAYLNQIAYVTGKNDQKVRDSILERWAGTASDVERKDVVDELERQGIALLGQKYGLSGKAMDRVARDLQGRRGQAWSRMSDRTMYTSVKGENGKRLDLFEYMDESGNKASVRMPMDPSELPNWRPLTNLTDLDASLRKNRDLFQELSKAEELGTIGARKADALYNVVGETLNSFWKPLALISLRWPSRVVADESFRIMLMMGVLPHMKAWGEGARNVVHNQGVVRAREWWNGRQVKTRSLAEDSLRPMTHEFDPWDSRVETNPTGAVPASVLDFDKVDRKRYARLNQELSIRHKDTRTLAYYKSEGPKSKWMQQWDDRLAAAEAGESRGFFFDPLTGKAAHKGFAVSPYPGRMRSFGSKPTAREMNAWVEKNSDLFAVKGNRAAVWLDKDTGRWKLDVVKTPRTREDAMAFAAEAEAGEFYDITEGFTRYVADEDPMGHRAGASVFETGGFDQITTQKVPTPEVYSGEAKRGVGFGKRTWRTSDGRTVEGEGVFGTDARDPNIYYSATSSQGAFQGILGGHTRGLGQNRAKRTTRGYRVFEPGDTPDAPEAVEWAEAWTYYVNNHIRMSPIWKRMLNGESDEQIEKWLWSKAGRDLRVRMGPRGADPHKWVGEMRAIYDHTLPTAEARAAALAGEVDPKKVDDILPHGLRNEVHGQDIELTEGVADAQKMWFKFVDKAYTMLGSMPTDALVRHPFAANVYDLRMKNYLASVPADKVNQKVLAAAEASARAFAVKQTRRLLYNIADEMEGVHMFRFLSPFFQAQLEVMERYAHIWTRKPESLARTLLLFQGSQTASIPGVFEVVDEDGQPATKFSHDNKVIVQVNPFMRKIADKIPGLKGALDNADTVSIPVASMDLITQGDTPYLPSAGPLVTIPASEFYFRDRPWENESFVYKWLFPFGTPDGSGALERTGKGLLPAYARRAWTAFTADFDDSAFANRANIIYQDMLLAYQQGKRDEPPTEAEALEATQNEYMLRAFSSFVMPVPVTPQSPHQFWLDQGRAYRDKYGIDASERFYEDFGADAFAYFVESSKSNNGLAPTSGAARGYVANKKLVDKAPDLAGVLAGPFGNRGEFNDAVYQWQLENRKSPLSKKNMREIKDPADRIKDVQIDRGWIEYGKLQAAVDAELRARGLTSVDNRGAEDLKYWRDQEVEGIIGRNPAFSDAYQSRDQNMGDWLNQAYAVAFEKDLDGRTDIEGLRAYLISRAKLQEELQARQAAGLVESDSLSATENADLKMGWDSYTRELVSRNLLFAEIFHRYLDNDDLSVFINQEG